jgi:hypothetical protein
MELDDLRIAWQELDRRLDQERVSGLETHRWMKLAQARRGLRPLWCGQIAQIVAGVGLIAFFARLWVSHIHTPHLMLPALLVHGYGLLLVLLAARTLSLVARIDYAAPVVTIQRRLLQLQEWRSRVEWPLLGITGCFMWIPLLLAMFNAAGVDLWQWNRALVLWNVGSGFACMGIGYAIVRWVGSRQSARALMALEDSRAGKGVRRARQALEEVARFEQE